MGTLALDIETGSPFAEPPDGGNDTEYFELFAVAVAYTDGSADGPEVDVLFREGGWEPDHTADLLDRLIDWCAARDVERVLTYNGAWFDLVHLANWATELEAAGVRPGAYAALTDALPNHVDLALAAADVHSEELWADQHVLPDFKAYRLEGIDNESVRYADYDLNPDYVDGLDVDGGYVQGKHIGRTLADRYVRGIEAGLEGTATHRELGRLLREYCVSDVADLFALYESLGGERLDEPYGRPWASLDR